MKDYRTHLEVLRKEGAEAALISSSGDHPSKARTVREARSAFEYVGGLGWPSHSWSTGRP
jgi:hypothetical protein